MHTDKLKNVKRIYGIRPVIETIRSDTGLERLFIQNNLRGESYQELRKLISEHEISVQYVPVEKLNRITGKNHQGVIAYVSLVNYYKVEDVLPFIYESGKDPFLIILDRITDVRNLGAIARTAECAGVDAIVLPSRGSAQINEDAIKTSAGALTRMKVCRAANLNEAIVIMKDSGLKIIAATEKSGEFYFDADMTGPLALIMGSEDDGIAKNILANADQNVKIPLLGTIESLNVSVAAGIVLYEVVHQRSVK